MVLSFVMMTMAAGAVEEPAGGRRGPEAEQEGLRECGEIVPEGRLQGQLLLLLE